MSSDNYKLYVKTFFGYYTARFNYEIKDIFKVKSFSGVFDILTKRFNEKRQGYFRNLRDEFDPVFPENHRKGWYQKGKLSHCRHEVYEFFQKIPDAEVHKIALDLFNYKPNLRFDEFMISLGKTEIFVDLRKLIEELETAYKSEFQYRDQVLSEQFKAAYSEQMKAEGACISFANYSALLETNTDKKIFIPNQWFVIASYALPLYLALQSYRNSVQKIMSETGLNFEQECKSLRYCQDSQQKLKFTKIFREYFLANNYSLTDSQCMAEKLLLFVTDYDIWYGQKTIDRNDFFYSPVLKLLNLVNASQSYVAQIVYYYSINEELRNEFSLSGTFTIAADEMAKAGESDTQAGQTSEDSQHESEVRKVRRIKIPTSALGKFTSRRIQHGK